MERRAFDEMASLENTHWWFLGRREIISKLCSQFLNPSGANCLEIGFGTGGNVRFLSTMFRYVGLELSDYASNLAKENYPQTDFRTGSLPYDLNALAGERFDNVFLLDVLEHIEQDELSLLKVKEIISEAGVLVLTVPAFRWMWSSHDDVNHHKTRYNLRELREKLQDAGYEVQYISYFNFLLFPLALAQRFFAKYFKSVGESITVPGFGLNALFLWIFKLETRLIPRFKLPFGLSIVALARIKGSR